MPDITDAFSIRALVCAASPLPLLQALDTPGIDVCGVLGNAILLPAYAARLRPHAVLLADPAPDLRALLSRLNAAVPAQPPRVAVCFPAGFPVVDAVSSGDPAAALRSAMSGPCGMLAQPSLPQREEMIRRELHGIGLSEALQGFACILRLSALLSAMPSPAPTLRHWYYPLIAEERGISAATVEKRIRDAIETVWLRGDLAAQSRMMGLSVSAERGKPTNSELLYRLADIVCSRYDQILCRSAQYPPPSREGMY